MKKIGDKVEVKFDYCGIYIRAADFEEACRTITSSFTEESYEQALRDYAQAVIDGKTTIPVLEGLGPLGEETWTVMGFHEFEERYEGFLL